MSNVRFIQLANYTSPIITEKKGDKWVEYGEDNKYYQTLLKAKESPTNSALINGITDMIYGQGLYATDANRKPEDYAKMISLISEETMRRVCDDYYTMGRGLFQCIWNKSHNQIVEIQHMPAQLIRDGVCNQDGDVVEYYYADDWKKVTRNSQLTIIPKLGTSKKGLELLVVQPYKSGFKYYSPVEWQSGINYAFVEIELAKFHLNQIHNRFAANTIINFNNGRPDEDAQTVIENKVKEKFSGTEGDTIIVAFNDDKDKAATVESFTVPDVHDQYQFLSEEARRQLMISHKVTSPLLFGLPQNGGLGSNADEIKMASQLFDATIIKPMQRILAEGVKTILSFNQITLDVYFITSQPLEFNQTAANQADAQTVQQNTGVALSAICCSSEKKDIIDYIADDLIELGEDISNEWELVEESEVDYTEDDEKPTLMSRLKQAFTSTGTARPNSKSEQDAIINGIQYKTRYFYSPESASVDSREFCKKMVAAGKLYRKEDIIQMDSKVVNAGFGPNGSDTYSIWKYKGGARCHHKWMRRIYKKVGERGSIDTNSPNAKTVSTNQSEREGYRVRNPKEVAMKPADMPNEGFLNPR